MQGCITRIIYENANGFVIASLTNNNKSYTILGDMLGLKKAVLYNSSV